VVTDQRQNEGGSVDVYEIELDAGDLTVSWSVVWNGLRIASGWEFTVTAASRRAQAAIDAHLILSSLAA